MSVETHTAQGFWGQKQGFPPGSLAVDLTSVWKPAVPTRSQPSWFAWGERVFPEHRALAANTSAPWEKARLSGSPRPRGGHHALARKPISSQEPATGFLSSLVV